ncbi:MAG: N-acetyl-gamma-glutamyl-phosphate reductase [Methermicoccaceae archaeon]
MIKVGIIGASGYTGSELLRILWGHDHVEVVCATSRKYAGKRIGEVHKHLSGMYDIYFEDIPPEDAAGRCDVVFTAVPHTTAMGIVPELLDEGAQVIDMSADYRIPPDTFERVYAVKQTAPRDAVYGLSELHPEVSSATLCANPGCYPTGAILAAAPLASEGIIDSVVFDSKSGITGAGAQPTEISHYPNLSQNVVAYKLTTHRHAVEMEQELLRLEPGIRRIYFTPHIVPAMRGILTTAHIFPIEGVEVEQEALLESYKNFYAKNRFVRVREDIPTVQDVRGSNFCDIGLEVEEDSGRIVVVSAIDNLVKGASGQAIQNMNLMMSLPEAEGLMMPALSP